MKTTAFAAAAALAFATLMMCVDGQISCSDTSPGAVPCCGFYLRETKTSLNVTSVGLAVRATAAGLRALADERWIYCFNQSSVFGGPTGRVELLMPRSSPTMPVGLYHNGTHGLIGIQSPPKAAWLFKERADGSFDFFANINGTERQVGFNAAFPYFMMLYPPNDPNTRSVWIEPTTCTKAGTYPVKGSCVPCLKNHFCPLKRAPRSCGQNATAAEGASIFIECKCSPGLANNGSECVPCGPGQLCTGGAVFPAPCPAGFYCKTSTERAKCPDGAHCPEKSEKFVICPPGTHCPDGLTFKTCITPGTFCPGNTTAPLPCPTGSFCPAKSQKSTVCPIGTHCPDGLNSVTCTTPGTFCPGNTTAPLSCPAGSFCATPSQKVTCNAGQFCPVNATAVRSCNAGKYCPNAETEIDCGFNKFCPAGRAAFTPCHNNAATLTNNAISDKECLCATGYTLNNTGSCVPCLAGTFKSDIGNQKCAVCRASTYCKASATKEVDCPAGAFCPEQSSEPTLCPLNAYCPASSTKPIYCDSSKNRHNPGTGGISEKSCVCKPGTYERDGACVRCPVDHFCIGGEVTAVRCVAVLNLHLPYEGADSADKCECKPGYVSTHRGCIDCPENHYCLGGFNQSTACGPGAIVKELATSPKDCVCPSGTFGDPNVKCDVCAVNNFCPEGSLQETNCRANSVTQKIGAKFASDCVCAPGHEIVGEACTACPDGTHKQSTGNTACTPVPKNSYANATYWACPPNTEVQSNECVKCAEGTARATPGTEPCKSCELLTLDCTDTSDPAMAETIERCKNISCSSSGSMVLIASIGAAGASIVLIGSVAAFGIWRHIYTKRTLSRMNLVELGSQSSLASPVRKKSKLQKKNKYNISTDSLQSTTSVNKPNLTARTETLESSPGPMSHISISSQGPLSSSSVVTTTRMTPKARSAVSDSDRRNLERSAVPPEVPSRSNSVRRVQNDAGGIALQNMPPMPSQRPISPSHPEDGSPQVIPRPPMRSNTRPRNMISCFSFRDGMKFSNTLEFNAVREWASFYLAYDRLKRLIYDIEKTRAQYWVKHADVEQPLIAAEEDPTVQAKHREFVQVIYDELDRINGFYVEKEKELEEEVRDIVALVSDAYGTDGSDEAPLLRVSFDYAKMSELRERIRNVYINLCSLKEFVVLNYTGFAKILKKHDKVLGGNLRDTAMPAVEEAQFWRQNIDSAHHAVLNELISQVVNLYATVCCDHNAERAVSELSQHLKDFVVWERNIIWREMVGKERRVTAAGVKRVAEPPAPVYYLRLPFTRYTLPVRRPPLSLLACLTVFLVLLNVSVFSEPLQNRCFALLIFVSGLWATEVIPLFVTAMIIPFFIVVLGILGNDADGTIKTTKDAVDEICHAMFSPVILLLLGGFSIAAALSKFQIAKRMATMILARAGTKSNFILLTIMFVATFASMWLSNVAAPVLCYSVIQPILRTLEPGNRFARALVLGIALASNVGGMLTPISSPQNAIALNYMNLNLVWPTWLGITIPIALFSNVACWLMLLLIYRPSHSTPRVPPIRSVEEPLTGRQYYIIGVTIFTIMLWCAESALKPYVGHSGMIAILPMLMFFGTGILNKDDFNNFLWTVIMLAMGGTALGVAVRESKLLATIATGIQAVLQGQSVWVAFTTFCALVLVAATFISHTVSALIILPIVQQVGQDMPGGHADLLVMGAAIMCSGAMGLPISGFPNINAVSLEDATGQPYVGTKDFLKVGVPISVIVCLLTVSLGYGTMLLFGL